MAAPNRARAITAAVIIIAGFAYIWSGGQKSTQRPSERDLPGAFTPAPQPTLTEVSRPPVAPLPPVAPPPPQTESQTAPPPPPAPAAQSVAVAQGVPAPPGVLEAELDEVSGAIRDFRTAMGENPVGSNAEITRALLGDNPKQVKVPLPPGSSVNGNGELCDRWGTPYSFHQLSGRQMEIRSAGPDRKRYTADDLVIR